MAFGSGMSLTIYYLKLSCGVCWSRNCHWPIVTTICPTGNGSRIVFSVRSAYAMGIEQSVDNAGLAFTNSKGGRQQLFDVFAYVVFTGTEPSKKMPQDSLRSFVYRSFVICDDPKGVVECRPIRRSKTGPKSDECRRKARSRSNVKDQLSEVSRRAHKVNHVTDSCSNGLRHDGSSEYEAEDLLKGGLDLQDSLHMLGKLQETSHYMANLKKEKGKWDRVINDQVIRRTNSSPVGEQNFRMESQSPRLSADGSSRDCIEELREVIRDSLARQNLLPNLNVEEKRCFSGRFSDSASDIPSTSSSQSSTVQTNNFTSMDSSISLTALDKKAKGPSLIAKLLGLEDMPSKPLQTNSFSTMKDIPETMHFKGLLKCNFIKEIKYGSHQWSDIILEQKLINNSPPIVLIKPRLNPCLQPQKNFVPLFKEEESLDTETMLAEVKVKEEPPSINSDNRGLNINETPVKRLSSRDGAKDSKDKEAGPMKKDIKTSELLTMPLLKKAATRKKIEKIPKSEISSMKQVDKEVAKVKNLSRYKDAAKVTPPKSNKLENGSNVAKNKMSYHRISTANSNSSHRPQTIVPATNHRKKIPTKKEKTVSKATTTAKVTTKKLEYKGDGIVSDGKKIDVISVNDTVLEGKIVDLASESDNVSEEYSTETADPLPTKEGTEHTDILIGDNSESSVCDVTPVTTDDQDNRKSIRDIDDDPIMPIGADSKIFMRGTRMKALTLSSPDFLNHVGGINDFMDTNTRLSLDCTNEIIQLRSSPDLQLVHPRLSSVVGKAKSHISVDHLLKGICDGIEALGSYGELAGKNCCTSSLYSMLERDLKHKEVLSGIWDWGSGNGFSVNDTMQVVDDIEKQLLSGLIEEICA
ncbi:hypothetical protein V6N13_051494 [Hibiscus sabdariffa]